MPSRIDDLAVAQTFLKRGFANDWDGVRAVLAEGVTWTMPGENRISGVADGREAVLGRLQQLLKSGLDLEKIRVVHWLVGLDGVSVIMHNAQEVDGHAIDEHMVSSYQVEDGRLTSIMTHVSDLEGLDSFFTR